MTPFEVKDCALLTRMSGLPPAFNLRELRERIAVCGDNVLFHHFCETTLRATFDNPDYRNDFAVWSKLYLGDRVLAERLGILDPYAFPSLGELRAATLEVIDERLGELTMTPWAHPGDEFFFMEATTVMFSAGIRISHPSELADAIRKMTNGSIYFHFLEARRRPLSGKTISRRGSSKTRMEGGTGRISRRCIPSISISIPWPNSGRNWRAGYRDWGRQNDLPA